MSDSDKRIIVELTRREAAELLYAATAFVVMRTAERREVVNNRESTPIQRGSANTQLRAAQSARDKLLAAVQQQDPEVAGETVGASDG